MFCELHTFLQSSFPGYHRVQSTYLKGIAGALYRAGLIPSRKCPPALPLANGAS